jgi:proteasome lid subunit RPN8/RPN11
MVSITPSALAAIRAHARSAYPEECCGLLLAASAIPAPAPAGSPAGADAAVEILDTVPAQNLAHANRAVRFNLDPRAYIHADHEARQRGLVVVGCYHSHPDHPAIPSATDASLAWDNFLYLILPVTSAAVFPPRAWQHADHAFAEIPVRVPPVGVSSPDGPPPIW